jgi:putative transcriptional regulator
MRGDVQWDDTPWSDEPWFDGEEDELGGWSPLRAARYEMALRQAELAAEVGVSRETISAIECGRQIPSVTLALALARRLETPVETLF